ncbi:MAG: hypothetical protein J6386_13145 [Candidatus Synoicihabitans palmerolidicus]|nr:hypothetical protein [Candidatus Synoicihabitans palmerolidicus]
MRGKPVIMTKHGGQLDYLTEEESNLVSAKMGWVPVFGFERQIYEGAQHWAIASTKHAITLMRKEYRDQAGSQQRAESLRRKILARFNGRRIAKKLKNLLDSA